MRSEKIMVRVSNNEKSMFDIVAKNEGLATSTWVRRELLRMARGHAAQSKSQNITDKPNLLSLFCGSGGLDQGFKQADFHTSIAIDNDQECINTFMLNHPESTAKLADITRLSLEQLDNWAGGRFNPIGVLGGPPCQSFTISNVYQSENDPRHKLPEAYAALLAKLNRRSPISFFVFENVPGLLGEKHKHRYLRFKSLFEDAGFKIYEEQLDAKDYGVPQERERIFIVGINRNKHPGKVWTPPMPEGKINTVKDTIGDLPEPVFFDSGLDPQNFPVHSNHWCLVPRSNKFGKLKEGHMNGRSFRTLSWDRPSWTVAYGHREVHVHPKGHRRLSIYEAMLLQSFPKTYRLTGTLSDQIRLVSDAVPPRLSFHIAQSVRRSLAI